MTGHGEPGVSGDGVPAGAAPATPLAGRVVTSSIWLLLNSVVVRGASFVTQIVLAGLLSRQDFGVYAVAIAASAMLTNFSGGGMTRWMVQGGRDALDERAGPTFWVSLASNVVLGGLLAAISQPAAIFFGSGEIRDLLLVLAVSQPLMSIPMYFLAVLSIDLRMRQYAIADAAGSFVRYGGTVVLALSGFGPMSFVLPVPITYMVSGLFAFLFVRTRPWRSAAEPRSWGRLLLSNRWILISTAVITVSLQSDNLILGRLSSLEVVGVYFFAYQLSFMTATIVTQNVRVVLLPSFVAVRDGQRNAAIVKASIVAVTVGTPLLLLLAACIAQLEPLLWDGRWAAAVVPIQVLSIALPVHLLTAITHSSLQSEARFQTWAKVNFGRAMLVVVGATVAGVLVPNNVAAVSAIMASTLLLADSLSFIWALKVHSLSAASVARQVANPLLSGLASLGVAILFSHSALSSIVQLPLVLMLFIACYLVLVRLTAPSAVRMSWQLLEHVVRRPRESSGAVSNLVNRKFNRPRS